MSYSEYVIDLLSKAPSPIQLTLKPSGERFEIITGEAKPLYITVSNILLTYAGQIQHIGGKYYLSVFDSVNGKTNSYFVDANDVVEINGKNVNQDIRKTNT